MRIKLDENLPPELSADLSTAGHDTDTVADEGLNGRPDTVILDAAKEADRILFPSTRALPISSSILMTGTQGWFYSVPGLWGGLPCWNLSERGSLSWFNTISKTGLPWFPTLEFGFGESCDLSLICRPDAASFSGMAMSLQVTDLFTDGVVAQREAVEGSTTAPFR